MTDGDKEEVAYYEYDAWGNIMTEAGTWRSPYCFSTRERDYGIEDGDYEYNSGLIYFGARYYSAEMGRWTQRDPLGTVDGLNLYLYVNNEPANGMDPWGLEDPSAMAEHICLRLRRPRRGPALSQRDGEVGRQTERRGGGGLLHSLLPGTE